MANIIHTCQVGFHVDFSSIEDVMGWGVVQNYPHVKLKHPGGGVDTMTNKNSSILKNHDLMTFA